MTYNITLVVWGILFFLDNKYKLGNNLTHIFCAIYYFWGEFPVNTKREDNQLLKLFGGKLDMHQIINTVITK